MSVAALYGPALVYTETVMVVGDRGNVSHRT